MKGNLTLQDYLFYRIESLSTESFNRKYLIIMAKNGLSEDQITTLIQDLRSLIQREGKIQCPLDDWYLLRSLRCTHFVLNDAYMQMKNFYNVQQSRPDIFSGFTDSVFLAEIVERKIVAILPGKAADGSTVAIAKIGKWDARNVSKLYIERMATLAVLTSVMDEEGQKNGIHVILDYEGVSWPHFRALGYQGIKDLVHLAEDCAPCIFNGIHVINESWIANFGFKIAASFATSGFIKNVKMYGTNYHKEIYKLVPNKCLPEEYGGAGGPMDYEFMTRNISELII